MGIASAMYSAMAGCSPLTALVAVPSIKPQGNWQGLTLPYIIHFPISRHFPHAHGQIVRGDPALYQLSVFSSSQEEGEHIVTVIEFYLGHVTTAGGIRLMLDSVVYLGREPDTGVHHHALTFSVSGAVVSSPP